MPFTQFVIPIGKTEDAFAADGAERTVSTLSGTSIPASVTTDSAHVHISVVGTFDTEEQTRLCAERALAVTGFPVFLVDPDTDERVAVQPTPAPLDNGGAPLPEPTEDQA